MRLWWRELAPHGRVRRLSQAARGALLHSKQSWTLAPCSVACRTFSLTHCFLILSYQQVPSSLLFPTLRRLSRITQRFGRTRELRRSCQTLSGASHEWMRVRGMEGNRRERDVLPSEIKWKRGARQAVADVHIARAGSNFSCTMARTTFPSLSLKRWSGTSLANLRQRESASLSGRQGTSKTARDMYCTDE